MAGKQFPSEFSTHSMKFRDFYEKMTKNGQKQAKKAEIAKNGKKRQKIRF